MLVKVSETDSVIDYTYTQDSLKTFYRGEKRYALSNHLGNVLAVITDRRIQACGAGDVMYYNAQVVSVSDYYPFGMGIKEREWKDSTFSYRFGFNGQEKDDEVSGEGNSLDFGARIYDSRLGRWMSLDPYFAKYPGLSAYNFAKCSPIMYLDPDGRDVIEGAMYAGYSKKKNAHLFERSYFTFTRSKTAQQFIRNFSNGHDSKLSVIRTGDKKPGKWSHHTVEFVPSESVEYATPRGWNETYVMTKDGTFKYIGNVTEQDLEGIAPENLQIKIRLNVQTADIETAEGGQIIAHEAFVHGEKYIEEAEKIRSEKNVSPAEMVKRLKKVNADGHTAKKEGHHKQFKYGKAQNYENWMKDIEGSTEISEKDKTEVKESSKNDKDNQ